MNRRLDKYQLECFHSISDNKISVLTGNKSSGKSFLLRYLMNKRWTDGKSTLIIVPDINQAKLFQKHLGEFHLNKYSLIIDNTEKLSAKNIIKIRALSKETPISITKKNIQFTNIHFDRINTKLITYYNKLNENILFNKSLSQLILINAFDVSSFKNIYFNQIFETDKFEFNESEYTSLQNNIKKAFEFQSKGENKIDKYFLKKAYSDSSSERIWHKISEWLKDSRVNILNVIQTISSLLQEQSYKQFNIEWSKIANIFKKIEVLLLEIDNFNVLFHDFDSTQSNFLGLDKSLKDQKDKYLLTKQKIVLDYKSIILEFYSFQTIKDNYPNLDPEINDIDLIQKYILKIIDDSTSIEKSIHKSIRKELKSMNFRNTKNEFLSNLQKDIEALFRNLNEGFATKVWENNAFSINKQLIYLELILEDLNTIEGQKNNFFSNYNWNRFLHSIDDKSLYLIRKLNIYRPKNWMVFFKNYYIQNLILKNKHHLNNDVSKILASLIQANNKTEKLAELKSIKIWQNKRKLFINKLRSENESLFKSLFNQTNNDLYFEDIEDSDLFTEFFPVIIIPENTYSQLENKSIFSDSLIIYKNADSYKQNLLELVQGQNLSKSIFTIEENDDLIDIKSVIINNFSNESINYFELKGYHQQGMINLLDMNYSERLYAARNLAHLLQSTNGNIKIFQMKNTIIFSALDEILNKVLLKLMGKYGIKEMRIIDTPFHLLVDNLLEVNRKRILLTQNNLLDYSSLDNILWQLNSIEKINKGGVKIVNFNTSDLLDNPIVRIKEFVKTNLL